jgi:hypothetical protein
MMKVIDDVVWISVMAIIIMKIMCNINVANNESDNGYCGEWRIVCVAVCPVICIY